MGVLFLSKLGSGSAHSLSALFIMWQFNSRQVSFVFASSNLISRFIASLAPQLGEYEPPTPMIIIGISSGICMIACAIVHIYNLKADKEENRYGLKDAKLDGLKDGTL